VPLFGSDGLLLKYGVIGTLEITTVGALIERHPGGVVEWRRREWSHDVRFFLLAWRRSVVMQGLSSS
jgi:hypothetical protein